MNRHYSLRILDFPYVIQQNIVDKMKLSEVVFLSLCSERAKQMVKSTKIRHDPEVFIQVIEPKETRLRVGDLYITWMWNTVIYDSKMMEIMINGVELRGRLFKTDEGHPHYITYPTSLDVSLIYNHLADIFRESPKVSLASTNVLPEVFAAKLPKTIDSYTLMSPCSVPAPLFDTFLDKTQPKDLIECKGNLKGKLRKDSLFWTCPTSIIHKSKWVGIEELETFESENIILYDSILTTDDFIQYLSSWKAGKFSKLQNLTINLSEKMTECFDREMIHEILEAKPWNPDERPAVREHPLFDEDCTDHFDIKREDGTVATIYFESEEEIGFFVWS